MKLSWRPACDHFLHVSVAVAVAVAAFLVAQSVATVGRTSCIPKPHTLPSPVAAVYVKTLPLLLAGACKPCPEGSTTASERSHSQSQCNLCLPGFKAVVTCMPDAGAGPSGETTEQEQSQQQNITHTRHLEQAQTQSKKLWQPLRKLRQQRRQLLASFHLGWQPLWKQQVQVQVPAGFADAVAGTDPIECPSGTFSPGGAGGWICYHSKQCLAAS